MDNAVLSNTLGLLAQSAPVFAVPSQETMAGCCSVPQYWVNPVTAKGKFKMPKTQQSYTYSRDNAPFMKMVVDVMNSPAEKDLVQTVNDTKSGMDRVIMMEPIATLRSDARDVTKISASEWQRELATMKCPADFCKWSHAGNSTAFDDKNLVERGLDGVRWEQSGSGAFFSMALFPTIYMDHKTDTLTVRPYAACYSSHPPNAASILHHPKFEVPSDALNTKPFLDTSLVGDQDCYKSVMSALNLCHPIDGSYIWFMPADQLSSNRGIDAVAQVALSKGAANSEDIGHYFTLGGASLGLATIACQLKFEPIAYTGFVRRFRPDGMFAFDVGAQGIRPHMTANQKHQRMIARAAPKDIGERMSRREAKEFVLRHMGSMLQHSDENFDHTALQTETPGVTTHHMHNAMIRVARGSDIVCEVDMTSFKCGWAMTFGFPMCIPYSDPMGKPVTAVLDPANPVWTRGQRYALQLNPNAYSMVQVEAAIPYDRTPTPILIACTVDEAHTLGEIATKEYLRNHGGSRSKRNREATTDAQAALLGNLADIPQKRGRRRKM